MYFQFTADLPGFFLYHFDPYITAKTTGLISCIYIYMIQIYHFLQRKGSSNFKLYLCFNHVLSTDLLSHIFEVGNRILMKECIFKKKNTCNTISHKL